MEHDRWLENLSRLFDGDLKGTEKSGTEVHLRSCPQCAQTWRLWEETRLRLSPLRNSEPRFGFETRVLAALDAPASRNAEPRLIWAPWLGLAAAAAFVLAVSLPSQDLYPSAEEPTALLAQSFSETLPSTPVPDWMMETNP